jgi:hypothetical protein
MASLLDGATSIARSHPADARTRGSRRATLQKLKLNLNIMKFSKEILLVLVLAVAGVCLSGCPLLMIGSLGYTGYQYKEKEGVFAPGQPLGGPAPEGKSEKSSSSTSTSKPPPATNKDIE